MEKHIAHYQAHIVRVFRHDLLDDWVESAARLARWIEELNNGHRCARGTNDGGVKSNKGIGLRCRRAAFSFRRSLLIENSSGGKAKRSDDADDENDDAPAH